MRWRQGRESFNVEDRRRMPLAGGLKIGGGIGLVILLGTLLLGGDPLQVLFALLGGRGGARPVVPTETRVSATDDQMAEFSRRVLGLTEDTWSGIFGEAGRSYRPPTLVLFTNRVSSACGIPGSATGPFYCLSDAKLYVDLGFFEDLRRMADIESKFDFAAAYVIAHEVGHHVQNLLGMADAVRRGQARSPGAANQLSVAMELQADCYAGVFAARARGQDGRPVLEGDDVGEGMRAAAAIGDDRLMRNAGRDVAPESFTHGSSDQRMTWLRTGLREGDPDACDTFAPAGL
jgi:predicted metalloprotease